MPVETNLTGDEKWEFDAEVAAHFEDMLSRSIPQYEVMRDTVARLTQGAILPGTWVIDLGCSRGSALASVKERCGDKVRYLGLEISEPMVAEAKARFEGDYPPVQILQHDLRDGIPHGNASVILSILTLQFTPIEHRQKIIKSAYDSLNEGGMLILVEKVLGESALIDEIMVEHYYEMKQDNGYSGVEIERKRLSLEGVLVPVTAKWNEELLDRAGFDEVACFWRWMNFAGWVAIK